MATLLHVYAHDLAKAYGNALRRVDGDERPGAVHGLRVSMKRMRTLLRLAAYMAPSVKPPKKALDRFVALFRAAGLVRELEVSRKVVERVPGAAAARTSLHGHLRKRQKSARRVLRAAIARTKTKDARRLADYLTEVGVRFTFTQEKKMMLRYVDQELRQARALLRHKPSPEQLHDLRKCKLPLIRCASS